MCSVSVGENVKMKKQTRNVSTENLKTRSRDRKSHMKMTVIRARPK